MNAQPYNKSITELFFGGDVIAAMVGNGMRQLDELAKEGQERRRQLRQGISHVDVCPCGCGLVGGVCESRIIAMDIANEEIPF